MRHKKSPRDSSKLSGKPLSEALSPSPILHTDNGEEDGWSTSPDLNEDGLPFTPEVIDSLTLFLLTNPNKMSSNLFRADVLFDSLGFLRTPLQKERLFADATGKETMGAGEAGGGSDGAGGDDVRPIPAREVEGFELERTVVRRLIPRNPLLDRPLEQSCHFYGSYGPINVTAEDEGGGHYSKRRLVIYTPHVTSKEDLPWYHPLLQSWALLYDYSKPYTEPGGTGHLSLHFQLYPNEPIENRLERTLHALLNTQIRLARCSDPTTTPDGGNYKPNKDNVLPQHLVQDTYARLKLKYATGLCRDWVEDTEPSKHVFEDLAITAFLVELWRSMYGVVPAEERGGEGKDHDQKEYTTDFPGFVDVACGNGVLVYVLLMEGYHGWGFDARARKTWKIFPEWIQQRLREEVYIPKPFADTLSGSKLEKEDTSIIDGMKTHTGMFQKDTFIISNHADELTVWTSLMAALANPQSPLPFIAIPCCSHSLSGARYRYPPPKRKKQQKEDKNEPNPEDGEEEEEEEVEQNPQPATGDLKALRNARLDAAQPDNTGINKSTYAALTEKAIQVAEEIGYEVEKTMLRIPSTRNMGVIGGRRRTTQVWNNRKKKEKSSASDLDGDMITEQVDEVVRRECARDGGVEAAARIWIERARGLNQGKGQGSQKH